MGIDFLLERFGAYGEKEAVISNGEASSYGDLTAALEKWRHQLKRIGVTAGTVVSLEADFSPETIAILLALVEQRCIVVPLTSSVEMKKPEFRRIAEVERVVSCVAKGVFMRSTGTEKRHQILRQLESDGRPGLILFSSGSTGQSKAVVHDFSALLEKFQVRRNCFRTLTFLLFDHIGGLNTLLYTLSNGGCVVAVDDRSPDNVCRVIQEHRVELLPTSPTFLNLMLLSGALGRYDLSCLKLITYGTEVMPPATLSRLEEALPGVRLQQTYGLSEIGILRSKSRSSGSLWMKVGGEGFETRVVDGMLQIRARSAMLGYLNAESPFTEDGWLRTDDVVEVDGEYLRILGRRSEIINVGGEKVYPVEVENVIAGLQGVEEVAVMSERNAITGQLVVAKVRLGTDETVSEFRRRMLRECGDRLPRFKIPQKVLVVNETMHGERFKMMRR